MKIEKNTVVTLYCQLSDADDNPLQADASPLTYLHGGYDSVFPPLEVALEGKQVGDTVTVVLPPEDAYGEVDAELVVQEPRSAFPPDVRVGTAFTGGRRPTYDEETVVYRVVACDEAMVILDGNHPLAGKMLRVSCTVGDIRSANQEEVSAGKPSS
jgi:FKBP-type peptidyl-prolyl cis-trans isomerase SlyD